MCKFCGKAFGQNYPKTLLSYKISTPGNGWNYGILHSDSFLPRINIKKAQFEPILYQYFLIFKCFLVFWSDHRRSSIKNLLLKVSQNSQENTCIPASFLIKLQTWGLQLYQKNRLWHGCFPVNFVKFLRTTIL